MKTMADARYSTGILGYLERIYAEQRRDFSCQAENSNQFEIWQTRSRPRLRELIGLDAIAGSMGDHRVSVELGESQRVEAYTRQKGIIATEPDVKIPFWLLRPSGEGPHPLGIFPHGHGDYAMDSYAGIVEEGELAERNRREDREVAVQAVRRGFVAIAPNTRGFKPADIPDLTGRHGNRNCRSQLIHCLLAGRTPVGERVWDMMRIIDWATSQPFVDPEKILMMGNSGGGVVTIYSSAIDTRISVAVPSCSFCTYVGLNGIVHHCDCNAIPGILSFGGIHDVAGLIAPRHLCIVNGGEDKLFPNDEVDRAVRGLKEIYAVAGVPD
ncbi:MAG: acetylxylan esterase, partial [Theionarchaea archaeon]|nr:acetylxylan esterase [Theionarchaea archaeon]